MKHSNVSDFFLRKKTHVILVCSSMQRRKYDSPFNPLVLIGPQRSIQTNSNGFVVEYSFVLKLTLVCFLCWQCLQTQFLWFLGYLSLVALCWFWSGNQNLYVEFFYAKAFSHLSTPFIIFLHFCLICKHCSRFWTLFPLICMYPCFLFYISLNQRWEYVLDHIFDSF